MRFISLFMFILFVNLRLQPTNIKQKKSVDSTLKHINFFIKCSSAIKTLEFKDSLPRNINQLLKNKTVISINFRNVKNTDFDTIYFPSHIKYLEFYYCDISKIPKYIKSIKSLEIIRISGTNIDSIKNDDFSKSRELKHITLLFIPTLKYINLSTKPLKKMEEILIVQSKIMDFSFIINDCPNLKTLHIENSPITSLPSNLNRLNKLETFKLENAKVTVYKNLIPLLYNENLKEIVLDGTVKSDSLSFQKIISVCQKNNIKYLL